MANYSAGGSTEFEWPPRDDVLERHVFRRDDPVEPPPEHAVISPPSAAAPHEEPHVVLRRALETRGAQTKSHPAPAPPARSRPRSKTAGLRAGSIALAALLAIVVLQTVYILRTRPMLPLLAALTGRQVPVSEEQAAPSQIEPAGNAVAESRAAPAAPTEPAAKDVAGTTGENPAPRPTAARLTVRSDPPGARVFIDGRNRGQTPVTVNGLAPGEHRIVLERGGVEVRETIRLGAGATVSLLAPMRVDSAGTGWIAVDSAIELDVLEDGALLGTSRSSRILLQSGTHTLQLVNERLNFRDVRQVDVAAGSVVGIAVALPHSEVMVNATPWAEVWIDGKHVGQTPIGRLSLPIGTYEVVFRHPELGEKATTAIVKAGAPTRVIADLRQPGIP